MKIFSNNSTKQTNKDKIIDSLANFFAFSNMACGFISCCTFKKDIIDKLHCKGLHWSHYDYLFNYLHCSRFYFIAKLSVVGFRLTEGNWWNKVCLIYRWRVLLKIG